MTLITQETYEEAVRENMELFGCSMEEAITDTIKQFESQGVDLSHIVTDIMSGGPDTKLINNAVTTLNNLVKEKNVVEPQEYVTNLSAIKQECDKGLNYRVAAGKEGAYKAILEVMLKLETNKEIVVECLKTIISLMTKQPDLLDDKGVQTMVKFLEKQKDSEVRKFLLRWIKECCVMHEHNRQIIFDANILDYLKPMLNGADANLLRDVLAVLRALVLDDDVRVEFGKAHEHARVIASDTLCAITELLSKFSKDENVINDIMLTLSSLIVRTEFCKKVEDAGGLKVIKDAMVNFENKEKIMRQCLKLLKALAGNDECKAHIVQNNFVPLILAGMSKNISSPQNSINGLACVAAITLRSPDNSKIFFEAGAPNVIIEIMKTYPDNLNIQKNASWAIRNMVSRSRYQSKTFLELGAEALLNKAIKKFPQCEYDIKAALRDLDCKVEFKEAWTGKGGLLNTQAKK